MATIGQRKGVAAALLRLNTELQETTRRYVRLLQVSEEHRRVCPLAEAEALLEEGENMNRPERPRETFSNCDLTQLDTHVNPIVRQLVAELRWWKAEAAFQNERAIAAEQAAKEMPSWLSQALNEGDGTYKP